MNKYSITLVLLLFSYFLSSQITIKGEILGGEYKFSPYDMTNDHSLGGIPGKFEVGKNNEDIIYAIIFTPNKYYQNSSGPYYEGRLDQYDSKSLIDAIENNYNIEYKPRSTEKGRPIRNEKNPNTTEKWYETEKNGVWYFYVKEKHKLFSSIKNKEINYYKFWFVNTEILQKAMKEKEAEIANDF